MGKTNFTKVEASLEEGLRKIEIERLLQEADSAAGKEVPKPVIKETERAQKKLIKTLELNLLRLRANDRKIYSKLKVKRSTVDKLIKDAAHLKEEDWKHLGLLLKKTEVFIKKMFPDKVDDKLIEGEKTKHINKRFNVSDKWIPLQ